MSYGLTTFAIAMVFSTLVPYVPVFAMLFFLFKYYVDKYNLSFVYNTEFHGVGMIKRRVVPLSIFNIIVYQLINVGFFASKAAKNGENFLYVGLAFVALEIAVLSCFHFSSKRSRFSKHRKMRQEQELWRKEALQAHAAVRTQSLTNSMREMSPSQARREGKCEPNSG